MEYRTLKNGVTMPMEGFGVFQVRDFETCRESVLSAIKAGYRLIDTAASYGNEDAVGAAVRQAVEEVMMRLFFMSLLVLIISKLFCKNEKNIPMKVFAAANIISALLFAAGHLPGTMAMTTLTPLLLLRCFLFNGGLGLCFGYLYRKYGIGYAMIAHGFAHLISDLLMIIFI